MLDVLLLALAGRAKPRLLMALSAAGVPAIGLTGLDAGLLTAVRKPARRAVCNGRTMLIRDDLSGRITSVRAEVLSALLDTGLTPVISPPALGVDNAPLNVDADRVASAVAVALGAHRLVLLTAAAGVLADPADPESLLTQCAVPATGPVYPRAIGGMHRKLIAAREALLGGVPAVRIADGRLDRPLWSAIRGAGTAMVLS
jgi:acetylglutamate/LysW-gamma-L-alpha-aminoadipate kinase